MLTYYATSTGPAAEAWSLSARPDRWHEWAPHIRGAWNLGDREVEEGRVGFVKLLGAVPVPVKITRVIPGRRWSWQVGPVTIHHRVDEQPSGTVVGVELEAPPPLEATLKTTYGPLVAILVRRLATQASRTANAATSPP